MLGDRLKLARRRAGLSLRALAEKLDVSAQAISKYETGRMAPSSSVLVALSKALGVSLDFLMSSQVEALAGIEFRKSSTTSAAERAQAEAAVTDALERWLALDKILEIDSEENDLPPDRQDVASLEEVDEAAAELRDHWRLGNDPIPSVTGLLEDKGIKIVALEGGKLVYGLTGDVRRPGERASVPVIVVGTHLTVERTRFTLAHELGHRVIGGSTGAVKLEKAMQRFAAAFLVPADHLKREVAGARDTLPPYSEIVRLKHLYGIAASAMLMRLCDVGVISEPTKTYAFQTYARAWRTEEPSPLGEGSSRLERPSRFERSVYWALSDRLISLPRAAEFLRRPVSQIERDIRGPSND